MNGSLLALPTSRMLAIKNPWSELVQSLTSLGVVTAIDFILRVSIGRQKLEVVAPDGIRLTYDVSTGKAPVSCLEGSHGTPLGWHVIAEKYGDELAEGAVLDSRKPTGKLYWEYDDWRNRSFVVTRILWLRGLIVGYNSGTDKDGNSCDTYKRYIYIHGTCHEDAVGRPNSGGCVTLRPRDVIQLYALCPVGTAVLIEL
ncbi:MAG: L,D-transpeptidase [Puniceicoccales bacterium]|jgi:hypothetical protein|nr:L,D-transpeptidase [Puniceicoccales bacterium]